MNDDGTFDFGVVWTQVILAWLVVGLIIYFWTVYLDWRESWETRRVARYVQHADRYGFGSCLRSDLAAFLNITPDGDVLRYVRERYLRYESDVSPEQRKELDRKSRLDEDEESRRRHQEYMARERANDNQRQYGRFVR